MSNQAECIRMLKAYCALIKREKRDRPFTFVWEQTLGVEVAPNVFMQQPPIEINDKGWQRMLAKGLKAEGVDYRDLPDGSGFTINYLTSSREYAGAVQQ